MANENKNIEEKDISINRNYNKIRKDHVKDFNKGLSTDENTDHVNKWISEDINYYKRVIELKSDYLKWIKKRKSSNKEIVFNNYISEKKLTKTETAILYDYHKKLFKNSEKKKVIISPGKNSKISGKIYNGSRINNKQQKGIKKNIETPEIEPVILKNKTDITDHGISPLSTITIFLLITVIIVFIISISPRAKDREKS